MKNKITYVFSGPRRDNYLNNSVEAKEFYYAEEYHQQYLGKNPNGYCGMGGTGVCL